MLRSEFDCTKCRDFAERNCTGLEGSLDIADPEVVWKPPGWLCPAFIAACPSLAYRDDLARDVEPLRACPLSGVRRWHMEWIREYKLYMDGHGPAREDMSPMHMDVYDTLGLERARMTEAFRKVPKSRQEAGIG